MHSKHSGFTTAERDQCESNQIHGLEDDTKERYRISQAFFSDLGFIILDQRSFFTDKEWTVKL